MYTQTGLPLKSSRNRTAINARKSAGWKNGTATRKTVIGKEREMKFKLEIETDDSVFDADTLQAVSEILNGVAYDFEIASPVQDIPEGKLRVNNDEGNSISYFVFEE